MQRKTILMILLLAMLLSVSLSACGQDAKEELTVTLLSVGRADAIVLQCGRETMVIDTGETDDGRKLLRFLGDQGVEKADLLIVTHFDKDHVGGAARLAEQLPLGRVLLPDYEGQRPEYKSFMAELGVLGLEPERLTEPLLLSLGGAEVLVEPPPAYLEEVGDNDRSLITTVTYGERRLVFMGDSEKLRIRQWLAERAPQPCDFVKMPHHGDYNKALPELLAALKPRWAAICDSDKNPAAGETLSLLREVKAQAYRTSEGTVRLICDGKDLRVEQEN